MLIVLQHEVFEYDETWSLSSLSHLTICLDRLFEELLWRVTGYEVPMPKLKIVFVLGTLITILT